MANVAGLPVRPITIDQLNSWCTDHGYNQAHWYYTDFNWLKWTVVVGLIAIGVIVIKDFIPALWTGTKAVVTTAVSGVKAGVTKVEAAV